MRTVSSKVDNTLHEKLLERCNGNGCTASQYIKNLIELDVNAPAPAAASESGEREIVKGATSKVEFKDGTIIKATPIHYINKDGKPVKTVYPATNPGEKTRVVYYDI